MPIDPDLAAVLLAFLLAAVVGTAGSAWGSRRRRRGAACCESCGRRIVQSLPTCDCNIVS